MLGNVSGTSSGYEAIPGKGLKCMVSDLPLDQLSNGDDPCNFTASSICRKEFVHASKSLQQPNMNYQVSSMPVIVV